MPRLLLPFILLILGYFALLRNRSQRSFQEKQDAFWEKEARANHARKQDISNLDYIKIPLDTFPVGQYSDETLSRLENELAALSSSQILNLTGISNTDLKLTYGAANLPILSECDARYTLLARTVLSYGKRLAELEHIQEAITVLEFGISYKTDVSTNYTLLGELYQKTGQPQKISSLIQIVSETDMLLKDSIIKQLQAIP